MKKHACETYLLIGFDFDKELNAKSLKEDCECSPEELGITRKDELENCLKQITTDYEWQHHCFVVGFNDCYDVDVNVMIRKTIKDFIGKEDVLRKWQKDFNVYVMLEIVPEIVSNSETPSQILSLDKDIIAFLYNSGIEMDMDYYIY